MNFFDIYPAISFLSLLMIILTKIIFLKRKGIRVSSGTKEKTTSVFLIYMGFSLIFLLWLFEITKSVFHFSIIPEFITRVIIESILLKIIGIAIIAVALFLLLLSLLHFKNSLRFGLDEKTSGELITTGIFSVSRNPFFLSLILYVVGIATLLPTLFLIAFSLLTIASIHLFILQEEKFLRKNYGIKYKKYAEKVRRYF